MFVLHYIAGSSLVLWLNLTKSHSLLIVGTVDIKDVHPLNKTHTQLTVNPRLSSTITSSSGSRYASTIFLKTALPTENLETQSHSVFRPFACWENSWNVLQYVGEAKDFATSLTTERSGRGVGLLLWWLFVPIWRFGNAPNRSFFLVIFSEWTVTKGNQNSYS